MRKVIMLLLLIVISSAGSVIYAQDEAEADTTPDNVLFEKQWSLGLLFHTNGWGLKFRKGKNINALKQRMFEIEFSSYKSQKEVRTINPYFSDSRSYVYGKLNNLYFLRGGIGFQHILNRKPYWGGIQLSVLYYGGLSIGISKPVYLYIIHFTTPNLDYEIVPEKYNPEVHFVDNIYGRAPFLTGALNLHFHPGIYAKCGLDFEFGVLNKRIKSLEVGAMIDYTPIAVPIMAYNPKQSVFLVLYFSFSLGKRYN